MSTEKKVVLITGCSSGFGYGMALKFARNDYITFAAVRDMKSEGAKQLKKSAKDEHLDLYVITIDVTKVSTIKKAIKVITNKYGKIDILVNNAGYGYLGPIEDTDINEMHNLYETNIFGVLYMTQEVVPLMRKKRRGLIINFSSISGHVPFPLFSIYSSTKFAIETMTEGLRFELAHFGINVVLVIPGSYMTNFSKNRKQSKNMTRTNSPYKKLVATFFSRYKKTHKNKAVASKVANPQEVINAVYKIAHEKNPKLRHLIGQDAFKNYTIYKLLPYNIWEWLLRKTYKW